MKDPEIKKRIRRYLKALETGKAGYKMANDLLEELIGELRVGENVALDRNQVAQLVDKFAVTNRVGAGLGVNRYEIQVSRASNITKKL
jgi:hypothetical protein